MITNCYKPKSLLKSGFHHTATTTQKQNNYKVEQSSFALREQSLSMTGTGVKGTWIGHEIFSIKFYGVRNFLDFLCWGIK